MPKPTDLTPLVEKLAAVTVPSPTGSIPKFHLFEDCPGMPYLEAVHDMGCCDGSRRRLVSEDVASIRVLEAMREEAIWDLSESRDGYSVTEAILRAAVELESVLAPQEQTAGPRDGG